MCTYSNNIALSFTVKTKISKFPSHFTEVIQIDCTSFILHVIIVAK